MCNFKALFGSFAAILSLLLMPAVPGGAATGPGEPPLEVMIGSMIMCGFRGAAFAAALLRSMMRPFA